MLSLNELVYRYNIKYDKYIEISPMDMCVDHSLLFFNEIVYFKSTKVHAYSFN